MKHLILTIITLFLLSCHAHKPNNSNGDDNGKVPKEVVLDMNFQQPKENADFKVLEASIEGDILKLKISYSGGCESHEFNAYFNGIFMKSMPPKAGIFIEHINKGDMCKKLETQELTFDLKNMRYPDKEGDYTIMIGLTNYEGYLEYKY